ncbi:Leucine carboxyl methyltransferase 2, partial [Stegodyphus mimosarum]
MQVQNTNDSSIVSKLSSANKGYFVDEFLNFFVARSQNRSPIINRGYYIRFKAIDGAFQSWFTVAASYKNAQIVSLGAGFDSSYFRYKSINKLPSDCRYIEIDFPAVIHRKLECIKRSNLLGMNFNSALKPSIKDSKIVASTGEYIMLGCDLNDTKSLQESFDLLEVNYSVPTLFLSECAITYMGVKSS